MKIKSLLVLSCIAVTGCITTSNKDIEIDDTKVDNPQTLVNIIPTKSVHVTVVGMEKSNWAGKCSGSEVDAKRMTELFQKIGYKTTTFISEEATYEKVRNSFLDGVNSELNILYYSGHGGSDAYPDTIGEDDGKDEYLCLYDKPMKDDVIWGMIQQCNGRVLLIFDCCHSETMYRVPILFEERGVKKVIRSGKIDLRSYLNDSTIAGVNMLCWSGCPDDKYSYGSSTGGMFTNALLKHYKSGLTYSVLWSLIYNDSTLRRSQDPRRTIIGEGFDGIAFK